MQRRTLTWASKAAENITAGEQENERNGDCRAQTELLQQKQEKRVIRDIRLERIRDNVQKLHTETLHRIDVQISSFKDSVLGELDRYENSSEDELFNGKAEPEDKNRGKDLEKRFIAKESPISELMAVKHIRSIYHMFVAGLILALCNGTIEDALTGGWQAVRIGFRHVPSSFGYFDRALLLWIFLFVASCLIHPLLVIWNQIRSNITSKFRMWCYDRFCLLLLLPYMGIAGTIVIKFMGDMAPCSSAFLFLEQTRFFMKIHAFVRESAGRSPYMPSFRTYLYFLFAPTLIYRDTYPRTSQIRWNKICGWILDFFGAILMLSCIVKLYILPEFSKFGLEKQKISNLVALVFRMMLPSSLFMLCGFFLFLHAWSNIWAELLRFADRRFYGPWWNSTSYFEYYRTWNCIVHDYLHTYIYKDVRTYTGSANIAKLAVLSVSALVHEYILALMLGFCYPVLFFEYVGIGSVLTFVKGVMGTGKIANILLFVTLGLGIGLQISLYSMEAFARINCPKTDSDYMDFFIPRSWTCNGLDM